MKSCWKKRMSTMSSWVGELHVTRTRTRTQDTDTDTSWFDGVEMPHFAAFSRRQMEKLGKHPSFTKHRVLSPRAITRPKLL